ncbi:MAG: hypothetical protein ACQER7_03770 [Bacteroidota bacterium]
MSKIDNMIQIYHRRKKVSEETIKELKKLNIGGIVLNYHEKMDTMLQWVIEDLKEIREADHGK